MSDSILEWKEPPRSKTGRTGVWLPLLEALRERPGEWALLRSYSRRNSGVNAVTDLKRGRATQTYDPKDYEFTTRSTSDGGVDVYGRYLNGAGA